MSPVAITLLVLVFLISDAALIGALVLAPIRTRWNALGRAFPARAPEANAVGQNFQSFVLGSLNLGWSIHVSVDMGHLHLRPARLVRWLGARPASVPWDAITFRAVRMSLGKPWVEVTIAGVELMGPAWCLEPAVPLTPEDRDR